MIYYYSSSLEFLGKMWKLNLLKSFRLIRYYREDTFPPVSLSFWGVNELKKVYFGRQIECYIISWLLFFQLAKLVKILSLSERLITKTTFQKNLGSIWIFIPILDTKTSQKSLKFWTDVNCEKAASDVLWNNICQKWSDSNVDSEKFSRIFKF